MPKHSELRFGLLNLANFWTNFGPIFQWYAAGQQAKGGNALVLSPTQVEHKDIADTTASYSTQISNGHKKEETWAFSKVTYQQSNPEGNLPYSEAQNIKNHCSHLEAFTQVHMQPTTKSPYLEEAFCGFPLVLIIAEKLCLRS